MKNKKIAIVGGGPGGLILARLLQMNGTNVTVYERDKNRSVRVQGATLDLHHESGLAALEKAGLMDEFKKHYRPGADKLRIVNKEADILFDDDQNENEEAFGEEAFRPEIDRGPLRDLLLNSLREGTVIWDSRFTDMQPENEGWNVCFENGTNAYADIVIVADGANSKVRSYITSIKPFYAGVTVVEGSVYDSEISVPHLHKLLNGGKIFALGNEKTLIVSSKGDGSLVFYTSCKTNEDWVQSSGIDFSNRAQVIQWFEQEFTGWSKDWNQLFEKAALPLMPRPQYCMPLDQTWTSLSNLTMLGDAAHLMPPFAGEGVNMAMLDALELSNCLLNENFTNTQEAIAAYENKMRSRASVVAKETMEQTEVFHSADALSKMLGFFNQFR